MSSLMSGNVDVASFSKFRDSPKAYQDTILLKGRENDSAVSMLFKLPEGADR